MWESAYRRRDDLDLVGRRQAAGAMAAMNVGGCCWYTMAELSLVQLALVLSLLRRHIVWCFCRASPCIASMLLCTRMSSGCSPAARMVGVATNTRTLWLVARGPVTHGDLDRLCIIIIIIIQYLYSALKSCKGYRCAFLRYTEVLVENHPYF